MRQSPVATKPHAMNDKILNDIDRRMRDVFAQSPAAELEKNVRALISSFFGRLDLVTREEFDIQKQVLLRTREKLSRLEAQVSELERKLVESAAATESPVTARPTPSPPPL
jgi:BMFP domain-containing protein YqiC